MRSTPIKSPTGAWSSIEPLPTLRREGVGHPKVEAKVGHLGSVKPASVRESLKRQSLFPDEIEVICLIIQPQSFL
jgi:hypothetical protein